MSKSFVLCTLIVATLTVTATAKVRRSPGGAISLGKEGTLVVLDGTPFLAKKADQDVYMIIYKRESGDKREKGGKYLIVTSTSGGKYDKHYLRRTGDGGVVLSEEVTDDSYWVLGMNREETKGWIHGPGHSLGKDVGFQQGQALAVEAEPSEYVDKAGVKHTVRRLKMVDRDATTFNID